MGILLPGSRNILGADIIITKNGREKITKMLTHERKMMK
jgi:hypothetical protein